MVATLNRPEIGEHCILVVRRAKCEHEAGVCLKPPIDSISIAEVEQRRRIEIIGGVADWNRSPHAHDEIVMVVTCVLCKSETRQKKAAQYNTSSASHGVSVEEAATAAYTNQLLFTSVARR